MSTLHRELAPGTENLHARPNAAARLNFPAVRECLRQFKFGELFIEHLGWSNPPPGRRDGIPMAIDGLQLTRRHIADLAGVGVYQVESAAIPDAPTRAAIHKGISQLQYECLLIFVDANGTQSLWRWVKRENGKTVPREHLFAAGQPGDLFISKLGAIHFDISEFDSDGRIKLTEVTQRLQAALDVQRVTKRFFREFEGIHDNLVELIQGIPTDHDRRWYASILLNRLMFIYFLQRKGFLDYRDAQARDGDIDYLQRKLQASRRQGPERFYRDFLQLLFFEGFAKPPEKRSPAARTELGNIRYLNGGLFLPHRIETENQNIAIPDAFFDKLFQLFASYSWNLNDAPGENDREISPHILGYIFEQYINQKAFGAYYTRPEITEYLCERTIHRLILDAANTSPGVPTLAGVKTRRYESVADLLIDLDAPLCHKLIHDVLPNLSLLDPACGSGAFLVAAMNTLIGIYSPIIGQIKFLHDPELSAWLADIEKKHSNIDYFIKKCIITDNLFGVDLMEEAVEIARLRLFLALGSSAETVDQLEPLPNIDFNILPGNSLIGLMRVDDKSFEQKQGQLFRQRTYQEILQDKNRRIDNYRRTATYADDLTALRNNIDSLKRACAAVLDDLLLGEFERLGIKFEQATWDGVKKVQGRPKKRPLGLADIQRLKPFHWGFEFDRVLNKNGGFDAIITNPPWEVFQTDEKEFFQEYIPSITKKSLRIEDWVAQRAAIMEDRRVREAWLAYSSEFPHPSRYFKLSAQYPNQLSTDASGRTPASKINLYKLFTEQCFNLLRPGGLCGIVIPSGIYTDLGSKQLREMLFKETHITGLFGFENRKEIFEGVHRSFKFVVLTFQKGGQTVEFPAAFMRHDVAELEGFPRQGGLEIAVDLVRRLSPDSLSIMEFKCDLDVQIAEKMLKFPLLGEKIQGNWNVRFAQELNMTNDSDLFETSPGKGKLPLYEGKMIWQFDHQLAPPRYWVDEKKGRARILGRTPDTGQKLDYQDYRLGFRNIARNTDQRTLVTTVAPPSFCANSFQAGEFAAADGVWLAHGPVRLWAAAILDALALDYIIRQRVSANVNFFYVYQLPVPRLTEKDPAFAPIVERAARLICTTPEFDELAKSVGLKSHKDGVTDPAKRLKLRAELDAIIAYLYGLTEEEFAHILGTFPIVPQEIKDATLAEFTRHV